MKGGKKRPLKLTEDDDTTTFTDETSWFDASDTANKQHIELYVSQWEGTRDMHILDLFGASASVRKAWEDRGWKGESYDIKLNPKHDITSASGFYVLLDMALRLLPFGLIMAGPPCSLFVFLSSSVHKRKVSQPMGDTSNPKVRLSNRILINTMEVLHIMSKRQVWNVLEQPANSFMYKTPPVTALYDKVKLQKIVAWMGAFGHSMPKCTHLLGSLSTPYWQALHDLASRHLPTLSSHEKGENADLAVLPFSDYGRQRC